MTTLVEQLERHPRPWRIVDASKNKLCDGKPLGDFLYLIDKDGFAIYFEAVVAQQIRFQSLTEAEKFIADNQPKKRKARK